MNVIGTNPAEIFPRQLFCWLLKSWVPGQDIAKCIRVSKKWKELILSSAPLKKKMVLESKVTIGPLQWALFGSLGDIPELPDDIKERLEQCDPYVSGMKKHQTHKLILILNKIGGNTFSPSIFKQRMDIKQQIDIFTPSLNNNENNETAPLKAYWALITTTNCIPKPNKKTCITKINEKEHYQIASQIEGLAFMVFLFSSSKINKPQPKLKRDCHYAQRPFVFSTYIANYCEALSQITLFPQRQASPQDYLRLPYIFSHRIDTSK